MRKILLAVMLMCAITGCGKEIYTGSATSMDTAYVDAELGQYTDISWYNGSTTNTGDIKVTMKSGKDATAILKQYDTSFIPFDEYETCSWIAINIAPVTNDNPPVFVAAPDSSDLVFNSIKYNGVAYRLKDGWYAAAVPNGMDKYSILVGTTRFTVKVERPDVTEVTEAAETSGKEILEENES